jgi:hypothetical protein
VIRALALCGGAALLLTGRASHAAEDGAGAPGAPARSWWVGAVAQSDLLFLPGGHPCSQQSQSAATYACFRRDDEQYVGTPDVSGSESIGVAYGTTRLLVHIERPVVSRLTLGGRIGVAFGGGPTPAQGAAFLPMHLELRAAWWVGPPLDARAGLRGFVAPSGGLAQVDGARAVVVDGCRPGSVCPPATNAQPGGANPDRQSLDAWVKTGLGFVGVGGGVMWSFAGGSGAVLELKAMQLFPSSGTTLSPSLSYVFSVS